MSGEKSTHAMTRLHSSGRMRNSSYSRDSGSFAISARSRPGEIHISDGAKKLRKQHKNDSVEMENTAFNDRFLVTSDDAHEAYYILTPHMMEYILTMAGKSGGEVYMAFLRGGKLHIAVKTERDFFELGKTKTNIDSSSRKFREEIKWFTDIIDVLRVEYTLYEKEREA